MRYLTTGAVLLILFGAPAVHAGDKLDAAVGGAAGGAVGAVIGDELGDRNGAIIGAAAGAAIGAAIATDGNDDRHDGHHEDHPTVVIVDDHQGRFCPPGQAKKGRC